MPLDGSPLAEAALDLTTDYAEPLQAELVLLRVVDQGQAASFAASEYLESIIANIRGRRSGGNNQRHVVLGSASDSVARAAGARDGAASPEDGD